jgi:hypothetical protein
MIKLRGVKLSEENRLKFKELIICIIDSLYLSFIYIITTYLFYGTTGKWVCFGWSGRRVAVNLALEKGKRVTTGGKRRGDIRGEDGEVSGVVANVPTTMAWKKV